MKIVLQMQRQTQVGLIVGFKLENLYQKNGNKKVSLEYLLIFLEVLIINLWQDYYIKLFMVKISG